MTATAPLRIGRLVTYEVQPSTSTRMIGAKPNSMGNVRLTGVVEAIDDSVVRVRLVGYPGTTMTFGEDDVIVGVE